MTDYSKLKVTELKELLTQRNLPTNGKKDELIARLTTADTEKASAPANGESPSETAKEVAPAPAASIVPVTANQPVEKKEIKQDITKPIAAESAPESTVASTTEGEKKKFTFKRLADEFETPAPTKAPEAVQPEEQKPVEPAEPTEPAEVYAAGLATTNAESELEKRKKRAARFGVPVTESIKLMERAKRFAADDDDSKKDSTIKALDSALGENRGKKRAPETRIQNEPPKKSKDSPKPVGSSKGVLSDPSEKAKAEARAKRFG